MSSFAQRIGLLARRRVVAHPRRYATTVDPPSRPPPPPPQQPEVETFSSSSKPRLYYARPPTRSDLPEIKVILEASVGVAGWAVFFLFAANQERLASSVVKQVLQTVRGNEELRDVLGDAIRPEPAWYLNGDPWINGSINLPAGHVDVSFRLKGHRGQHPIHWFYQYPTHQEQAAARFISPAYEKRKGSRSCLVSRPLSSPRVMHNHTPLHLVRFRVISDDGKVVNVLAQPGDKPTQ
ncbi:hypothetical protein ID866_7836 [Astraeus odoratus]|nr:hypothetical protein ID866_7836 [Astraeus odoratus]